MSLDFISLGCIERPDRCRHPRVTCWKLVQDFPNKSYRSSILPFPTVFVCYFVRLVRFCNTTSALFFNKQYFSLTTNQYKQQYKLNFSAQEQLLLLCNTLSSCRQHEGHDDLSISHLQLFFFFGTVSWLLRLLTSSCLNHSSASSLDVKRSGFNAVARDTLQLYVSLALIYAQRQKKIGWANFKKYNNSSSSNNNTSSSSNKKSGHLKHRFRLELIRFRLPGISAGRALVCFHLCFFIR
jgi:hypothetical protein